MLIIIALLLVAIIPTIAFSISKANETTKRQEETNEIIFTLLDRIEQMQANEGLTKEDVQAMIDQINPGLTAEEVQELIDQALEEFKKQQE